MTPTARRAATRQRLVDAAIGVIAAKGVLGSSVEEICEAAGFTRGAFYSNFDGKDELCAAILESHGRRYLAAAREAVADMPAAGDVTEVISHATAQFIAAAGQDVDAVLVMSELRLYAAREPGFREAFRRFDEAVTPLFAEVIEQGLAANGLRLTVSVGEALSLLHAVYDQTALDQLVQGLPPGTPASAERLGLVVRSLIARDE